MEKARSKRHIQDLQVDVTDGVILADVVEAVTNLKIPEINRKPKTSSQMVSKQGIDTVTNSETKFIEARAKIELRKHTSALIPCEMHSNNCSSCICIMYALCSGAMHVLSITLVYSATLKLSREMHLLRGKPGL